MRKLFRRYLPRHETVITQRWIKPFGVWLHHPNLWHLHRRSVAGGVAVGLFCGLIPGPVQMICAALMAVLLRVNLPVAAFTTFYTNPFTILPLYALAYKLGAWVSGAHSGVAMAKLSFPEMQWHDWVSKLWDWLVMLGEPILVGLPLLAVILASSGYIVMRVAWRVMVILKWRARLRRRAA
ncbi:MAG: DUF2062 domain-containing protein [Pseudomonadota bacterium]